MGNTILYRMVREWRDHDRSDIIFDKMLIIGRVYSASVTRGAGQKGKDVPDVEEDLLRHLAERVRLDGKELDSRIAACRASGRVNCGSAHLAIETHSFLNNLIVEGIRDWRGNPPADGQRKVRARNSFVSKYLHFHAPMFFFILDSIVTKTLRYLPGGTSPVSWPAHLAGPIRTDYGKHCIRMLKCAADHYEAIDWTPRLIDGHLMGYINEADVPADIASARDARKAAADRRKEN